MLESTDASKFKVRGPTYLTDGIKINSARSTFQCLAIHLCRVRTKIDHVAERTLFLSLSFESSYHEKHIKKQVRINLPKLMGALKQQQNSDSPGSDKMRNLDVPEYFVIQFQVPGYSMTQYFKMRDNAVDDKVFMTLYKKFCSGDDDFRNSRIKIIPNMVSGGGYMVKRMVGTSQLSWLVRLQRSGIEVELHRDGY